MPDVSGYVYWDAVVSAGIAGYGATSLTGGGLSYESLEPSWAGPGHAPSLVSTSTYRRLSSDDCFDRAPAPLLICDNYALLDGPSARREALCTLVVSGPMSCITSDPWCSGADGPFGVAFSYCGWAVDALRHAALGVPLLYWDGAQLRRVVDLPTGVDLRCGRESVDALFPRGGVPCGV